MKSLNESVGVKDGLSIARDVTTSFPSAIAERNTFRRSGAVGKIT